MAVSGSNTSRRTKAAGVAAVMALIASVAFVAVSGVASAAPPYPAPVMRGYVPLDADATRTTLFNASDQADTTLDFTVGITNAGAGAVMFYDHWEDGFESSLANPSQSTTQIWGDGDPSNGDAATSCGARCAGDLLPAGAVFVLRNNIPTPRTTAIRWDGRDRVSSTRGFTITAGGFSTPLGSVLSASASAYDTSKWGNDYWIPIGEDMTPPSGTSDAFSTTNVQVMADQPGTVVEVDRTGDGVTDQTGTLDAGEVLFVDGGVNRGARVRSSKPVQVHVGAGEAGAAYEMRWFTLFPTALLTDDYLNPVASSVNTQRTITYLFNPNDTPISVTPTCGSCTGVITVPARGGASFPSPLSQAVRFSSGGGEPFVAVGAAGAESGAQPGGGSDGSATYDWGFGLVPTRLLTPKAVLGWAPGNSANPPNVAGNRDDDPVWISTLADTTIYIDYDGDPATGANAPVCDGRYDESRSVTALQSERIFDNTDGDMTGASIYTCDGTRLAGAWGEDPANAPSGAPGFDAGYALIPSTAMLVDKTAGLSQDTNGDGRFGPGDRIEYQISIADAGAVAFTDLEINDPLPAGTVYVPSSTTYDAGDGSGPQPFADDAPPAATPYPFDENGAALPTIDPGDTVTIRYQVEVANPFPAGTSISNTVSVGADQTDGGDTVITELVAADLSLTKTVTDEPDHAGEDATFRVSVTNSGPDTAEDVVVLEDLGTGLDFVSATPGAGTFDPATGRWSVGDLAPSQTVHLDVVATVTALSATNRAEIVASGAADPDSTPANGSTDEDDDATATVTVDPAADVSLTKTRSAGPDANAETTFELTVTNDGPSTATGVVVRDEPPAGSTFFSATPRTDATTDGTFAAGTSLWIVPSLDPGEQAQMTVVYRTPTAPVTNYAQVVAASVHDPDSTPSTTPLGASNLPDEDDEAAAQVPAVADLSVTNTTHDAAVDIGDEVDFDVTVTNDGPTNAPGVRLTAPLPAGVEFVAADPSVGSYDPATGVWTVGDLDVDDTAELTLTVRAMAPGALSVTAQVSVSSADDVDSTPGNDEPAEDDQATASVTATGSELGDRVWWDITADGDEDAHEPGLEGVDIDVRWAGPDGDVATADDVVYSTTTDDEGRWSLEDLPHGTYRVTVDSTTLPFGLDAPTWDRDGAATPHTATFTVPGATAIDDVDFGYRGSADIGDRVFVDLDGSGTAGADEGIDGAALSAVWFGPDGALGGGDDVTLETATDADGRWELELLPAGTWQVTVDPTTLPAGLRASVDLDGGADGVATLVLVADDERTDVDFGYVGTAGIGDEVFLDVDGDGVRGPGEPGLGGVPVALERRSSPAGPAGSTSSTGTGTYLFEDLPPGDYTVSVATPPGLTATTPTSVEVTLAAGQLIDDVDVGFMPETEASTVAIAGSVFDDDDSDGLRDGGEPGRTATVELRVDADGDGTTETVAATQQTDEDGGYSFEHLPPGRYGVSTAPADGVHATTALLQVVELAAGDSVDGVDFGFSSAAPAAGSIGDLVFDDLDVDGATDPGEPGMAAQVTLRVDEDRDGTYERVVTAVGAVADGSYELSSLAPGNYLVSVEAPSGWFVTGARSYRVELSAGQVWTEGDFGLTDTIPATGSIGDRAWSDADSDGQQDGGEPGLNGVELALRVDGDGDGSYESVGFDATTAGDGGYLFDMLAPGSYLVAASAPDGLSGTVPTVRQVVVVPAGAVDDVDFGFTAAGPLPFDLSIDKSLRGDLVQGEMATWVLSVHNTGMAPAPQPVTVTDDLPEGLVLESVTGDGWDCTEDGQKVTCVREEPLDPGQSASIELQTEVTAAGGEDLRNVATVTAPGAELSSSNNDGSDGAVVLSAVDERTPPAAARPVAEQPPAQRGALAFTGGAVGLVALAGAAMLLAGLLLRRRRAVR
jgi:uncharacterized repeat protein (TIGR01451 family)